MNKWSAPSQDNLIVSLSLATSLAILVSAAAAIWVWSVIIENTATSSSEAGGYSVDDQMDVSSTGGPSTSVNER